MFAVVAVGGGVDVSVAVGSASCRPGKRLGPGGRVSDRAAMEPCNFTVVSGACSLGVYLFAISLTDPV